MNVFEFARKMEQDGEQYYRTLAKTVSDKGLVSVLTELADAEVRHKQVVEEMQKATARELQETPILEHAKNIFSVMENKGNGFSSSEIEAYKKALKIEKASEEFYRQKARELGNRQQSELFEQIAEEERKHYFLIENIIEFMQRPAQWLENAEWNHLDEY